MAFSARFVFSASKALRNPVICSNLAKRAQKGINTSLVFLDIVKDCY